MGQRSMLCTSQMIDFQMDHQGQGHLHPDPCIIMGSVTNYPQPNIHGILPASGNTTNIDVHCLPDHYGNAVFYGMATYGGVQHHPATNLDLAVVSSSSYYNPYMNPSGGARVFPVSVNSGSELMPSPSNPGVIGVPTDEYGRNNYLMDGVRGSCKRKNAECIPGNLQFFNAPPSSSSSVAPLNTMQFESGVVAMDAESSAPIQYVGNGTPPNTEVGSHRSVRNRSGAIGLEPIWAYNHSHLVQGNYMGQSFRPTSPLWLDQQLGHGGDGGAWNQAPAYLNSSNVNAGSLETGNIGVQGYHDTTSNRSSSSFLRPLPMHRRHHNLLHPPPPPMQGVRSQNINFHQQLAPSTYRLPTNNTLHGTLNPSQDGVERGTRHPGPVPSTGLRIYRPHREGAVPEATSRHQNRPYLRVLPADEVAMLEIPGFYEVGNYVDHHREMRLDIEDMSYEELLALGERIGNVSTGLSEENVRSHMKTRTYLSMPACIDLEEEACVEEETDSCIICQCDFDNQEKIGTLDCGHEYHADCLKKWLQVKNVCPVCKSTGLLTERKDDVKKNKG